MIDALWSRNTWIALAIAGLVCGWSPASAGTLNLGPEQIVQAGAADLAVWGYSVPTVADWDNDGRQDLVVGEGGDGYAGKVRVYLNVGTAANPQFNGYSYAQSLGQDLVGAASGCLGVFPRVVYWNGDTTKDLLIGQGDGTVKVYLNVADDEAPSFDAGTPLEVGLPGAKTPINVLARATVALADWDTDGVRDLVLGDVYGKVHVFINEGTAAAADYRSELIVPDAGTGGNLTVVGTRSSPVVMDLNDDGKKDLLTGNTNGQLLLYANQGSNAAPSFTGSAFTYVTAGGAAINLPGSPRSRPDTCYWTDDDALLDVLIGSGDGKVRLFQGQPVPGDANRDAMVDIADLGVIGTYYFQCGVGWAQGDFNYDTCVDVADLGALATHYGYGTHGAAPSAVPEPAVLGLLAVGGLALRRRRRA